MTQTKVNTHKFHIRKHLMWHSYAIPMHLGFLRAIFVKLLNVHIMLIFISYAVGMYLRK